MKKLITAAACIAAGTFLFSACSAMVATSFSANWLKTPSNYAADFYEELSYKLSFESNDLTQSISELEIDGENSGYTQTTQSLATFTLPDGSDRVVSNVYHMHSELTVSGTYYYTDNNGNKEAVCSFGGENDDPDKDYDNPASVVTDVYFHSLQNGKNLQPVYRTSTYYSYSPGQSTKTLFLYNYTVTVVYSENASEATLTLTDNWGDLKEEDIAVAENLQKAIALNEKSTAKNLQKNHTLLDEKQLIFAARGLNYSNGSSNTVNLMMDSGAKSTSLSCSEDPTAGTYSFSLDGEEKQDHSVSCASVNISISDGSVFTGEMLRMVIAQKTGDDASAFYALPVRYETPFGFGVGKLVYTLESCTHTPSDNA